MNLLLLAPFLKDPSLEESMLTGLILGAVITIIAIIMIAIIAKLLGSPIGGDNSSSNYWIGAAESDNGLLSKIKNWFLRVILRRSLEPTPVKMTGYKVMNVVVNKDVLRFSPVTFLHAGLVDAYALSQCRSLYRTHATNSFSPDCTCGFYSFKDYQNSFGYNEYYPGAPILQTRISGEFLEYTEGYRSQKQRVTGIIFPECISTSAHCTGEAQFVLFQKIPGESYTKLVGCCSACYKAFPNIRKSRINDLKLQFNDLKLQFTSLLDRLLLDEVDWSEFTNRTMVFSFEEIAKMLPTVEGYQPIQTGNIISLNDKVEVSAQAFSTKEVEEFRLINHNWLSRTDLKFYKKIYGRLPKRKTFLDRDGYNYTKLKW